MKTDKELHEEFLEDFKQLLKKYKAGLGIEVETGGWYQKGVPVVYFAQMENIRYYSYLELPSFIDGE